MPANVGQITDKMGNAILENIRQLLDHQRLAWMVAETVIKTHPYPHRAEEILNQDFVMDIQTSGEDEMWSVTIPTDTSFYVSLSKREYHIHDSCPTSRWCSFGTFQIWGEAGRESVSFTPQQETLS